MASVSTFGTFQSSVVWPLCSAQETQECFFPWILCAHRVTWAFMQYCRCQEDSGSLSTGPYSFSGVRAHLLGQQKNKNALPSSLTIITFCSTLSSPHSSLMRSNTLFSQKEQTRKAAKHRNGNLGGGGMNGATLAIHPVSRVLLMLHCHMKKLFSKFTPTECESQKAR